MRTAKTGEFEWIERIRRQFAPLVPAGAEGLGDDCAVIPAGDGRSLVVTADLLVEDVHFIRSRISPEELGRKSLAVNLSDVAAMGAAPAASFLSIGLPKDVGESWREGFLTGYRTLSEEFGVPLLGGDTTASEKIVIGVTAMGQTENERIKRRGAARPGELVCVTGPLGDSAAGLRLLLKGGARTDDDRELIAAHLRPKPYVHEGVWLGGRAEVRAMTDVSDGIASDLLHILEESGVGATVDLDRLPLCGALRRICAQQGWDAQELAATGGEDYVLLLTVGDDAFAGLNRDYRHRFGTELVPIGRVASGPAVVEWRRDETIQEINFKGFTHF
jgi:thiamine-monophosphate kinase